jgi:hypothetical protein
MTNPPSPPLTNPLDHEPVDRVRLGLLGLLIAFGWAAAAGVLYLDNPTFPDKVEIQGLSPAVKACYLFHSKASAIIIAVAIGLCLGISYIFGTFLYKKFRETSSNERRLFWEAVSNRITATTTPELRELMGAFREYENVILDKRNLYWSLFTRVTLAILVVGLIALLIANCKIESQAGLPIISGIIAFIIGQSADLTHSAASPSIFVSPGPTPRPTDGEAKNDKGEPSPPTKTLAG